MRLLIRPAPHADESLESYFLRLSHENGFERYEHFSGSIKSWLQTHDHQAAGAFPLTLAQLNVFHASCSSGLRIRALQLVEKLTDQASFRLLRLALSHSGSCFGKRHKAVHRAGVDIPLSFVRTGTSPCCPECMSESAYIRQCWHYKPYTACPRHGVKLIESCPDCGEPIGYLLSGLLTHCLCGFDLTTALAPPASTHELRLASLMSGSTFESTNPLLAANQLAIRYGALLWYQLRFPHDIQLVNVIDYFDRWPGNYCKELDDMVNSVLLRQTEPLNRTLFAAVFGDELARSRWLPTCNIAHNFILRELIFFLTALVERNPKACLANIGDILVSTLEAAALLSTSVEQVRLLQQQGFLPLAIRPAGRLALSVSHGAFHLRHVVELRQAFMSSPLAAEPVYISAW